MKNKPGMKKNALKRYFLVFVTFIMSCHFFVSYSQTFSEKSWITDVKDFIWVDINNDQRLDALSLYYDGAMFNYYYLKSASRNCDTCDFNTIKNHQSYDAENGDFYYYYLSDNNNDNKIDFLFTYEADQGKLVNLQYDSSWLIEHTDTINEIRSDVKKPLNQSWFDFDNDGDLDSIWIYNKYTMDADAVFLHKNKGTYFEDVFLQILTYNLEDDVICGDYDNDGDIDIVHHDFSGMPMAILYENTIPEQNKPPLKPLQTNSFIENDSILKLEWSQAIDDLNPKGTLYYNLRVGRKKGSGDLIYPFSDTTGFRQIIDTGNIGKDTSIMININEFYGGRSYWCVQAIDYNYKGGEFSDDLFFDLPVIQTKSILKENSGENSVSLKWTSGNLEKRIVFMKEGEGEINLPEDSIAYDAVNSFGVGSQISAEGWYCVYKGDGDSVKIEGLEPAKTYKAVVYEYFGEEGFENYFKDTISNICVFSTKPDVQSWALNFSEIKTNSLKISWNNGNGSKRVVFMTTDLSADTVLLNENFSYAPDSVYGDGTKVGNWYCVYNDSGNSCIVGGLAAGSSYRFHVCEYSGENGLQTYNCSGSANNPLNVSTSPQIFSPTIQAHSLLVSETPNYDLSVSWTIGNGNKRILFMKEGKEGTAKPSENISYIASTEFGNGSQIDSSGWFCVYNGFNESVIVTNINPLTDYRLMILEYNGGIGEEKYFLSEAFHNPVRITTAMQLCLVTVDSLTQKNMVIWEKIPDKGTESYNIYKLQGIDYQLLDNLKYSDLSVYIDYSSQPSVKSDRYKIAAVDSFGNETEMSPYHQTINLQVGQGVPSTTYNLSWNHYEDESGLFTPEYYYIYKGTGVNNLSIYDSVSGSFTAFDDENVNDIHYYQIAVEKPSPCDPAGVLKNKANNGPFSRAVSNLEDNRQRSSNSYSDKLNNEIIVFPNPADQIVKIKMSSFYKVEMINCIGKMILSTDEGFLDVSNFEQGVYFLRIFDLSNNIHIKKLIIN